MLPLPLRVVKWLWYSYGRLFQSPKTLRTLVPITRLLSPFVAFQVGGTVARLVVGGDWYDSPVAVVSGAFVAGFAVIVVVLPEVRRRDHRWWLGLILVGAFLLGVSHHGLYLPSYRGDHAGEEVASTNDSG